MAEGFYGRVRAYEQGLDGDDAAMEAALGRNLYGTAPASPDRVERMAAYVRREAAQLAGEPASTLIAGSVSFGAP
jgi:cytochrome b pre-mRNA-processing protein 3